MILGQGSLDDQGWLACQQRALEPLMNSCVPSEEFLIRKVKVADAAAKPVSRDLFWMVHPGMAVPV